MTRLPDRMTQLPLESFAPDAGDTSVSLAELEAAAEEELAVPERTGGA